MMIMKNKIFIIIIAVIVVLSLSMFFYPKKNIIDGSRGFIELNETYYTKEYSCFGIKHNFCPPWPDYGCDSLCYGLIFDKKCYTSIYNVNSEEIKTQITCNN